MVDGTIIPPNLMPADLAGAVKRIKRKEMLAKDADGKTIVIGHTVEVEMHDPLPALRLLGLEEGMFKEREDGDATADALVVLLREARERALQRYRDQALPAPVEPVAEVLPGRRHAGEG